MTARAGARQTVLAVLAAGLLAACSPAGVSINPSAPPSVPTSGASVASGPDEQAAGLEEAVNAARGDAGLEGLVHDGCAARVASDRAQALVGARKLVHDDLDAVLTECGVDRAAENLARSGRPAQEVVDAWLASPGHSSNILDAEYDRGAVACVAETDAAEADDPGAFLCSQIFLDTDGRR